MKIEKKIFKKTFWYHIKDSDTEHGLCLDYDLKHNIEIGYNYHNQRKGFFLTILKPYRCFCCSKIILTSDKDGFVQGGLISEITAHYGSKFDGNIYKIAICDQCIEERNGRLKFVKNYLENF